MIENSESVFGMKMLQKKEKRPQAKPGDQYMIACMITKQLIKQAIRNHKEIEKTTQSDLTNCIKRLTTR